MSLNLDNVNLFSGDFYGLQNDLAANFYAGFKPIKTDLNLIPESAEISNVSAYLQPLNQQINDVLAKAAQNIDQSYTYLKEINNQTESKMESLTTAIDSLKANLASTLVTDFGAQALIVSDTFKNTTQIDETNSSGLIDTTNGEVSLAYSKYEQITNYVKTIDQTLTQGNPGCYSEIANLNYNQGSTKAPLVSMFPTSNDFSAIDDGSTTTWFELERVFIPPTQKVTQLERSYVSSEIGVIQDVDKITQDFDWKIKISWNGTDFVDTALGDFTDPDNTTDSLNAKLVFSLDLDTPTNLSFITLKPLFKNNNQIILDKLEVYTNNRWVTLQSDIDLGLKNGINKYLVNESTLEGYTTQITVDSPIEKIKVYFTGGLYQTQYGIAHKFKDVYSKHRTERNNGLWRSADTWEQWGRVAVDSTVPAYTVTNQRNGLVGSIINIGSTIIGANNAINASKTKTSGGVLGTVAKIGSAASLGASGVLGSGLQKILGSGAVAQLGTVASAIAPYVIGLQLLDQVVGGLFSVNKTVTTLDSQLGWDVFKAYKSSVCIKELILGRITYEDSSTITSLPLYFKKPVTRVALYVDEEIPNNWPQSQYTTYSVSTDGQTWYEISRLSTLSNGYVEFPSTQQIYYKIDFKKYSEDNYRTPKVKNIVIQGL